MVKKTSALGARRFDLCKRWAALSTLVVGTSCVQIAGIEEPTLREPSEDPANCADPGRVDLLLAIDNSRSMADKQQILAQSIPLLIAQLVNPRCIDANGNPVADQPNYPTVACPAGSKREIAPAFDMHIGVISSSIGGHGSDSCPDLDPNAMECQPNPNPTNNDRGRLVARADQCGVTEVQTYQGKKFLAWDPTQQVGGETVLDDGMNGGLIPTMRNMVTGIGQLGCGFESQLESMYRFLIDPNPYETITLVNGLAVPMGTDQVLLQQRASFLRPDSLLMVIMLSDENDCSTKEYGAYFRVNQLRNGMDATRMPRPRQECAVDPNDPCCKSCAESQGTCPDDPTCIDPADGMGTASLLPAEDHINLRCWAQKRRFGIDFLYPVNRYVQGFSKLQIADRDGNIVQNPIFSDLDPNDNITQIRSPAHVLVTGLIGVPWQDIARDTNDLSKGYKTASELADKVIDNFTTWDVILGDPASNRTALDPLMIESLEKRTGTNPITGNVLVNASNFGGNPINGHEWTITLNDDIQYSCIFPLLPGTERDCTKPGYIACDCFDPANDNPVCAKNPANSMNPTLQVKAKAYPSLRQLSVLKDLGDQAIVASVCAAQVSDPTADDFGYRAAMRSIIEWIQRRSCKD